MDHLFLECEFAFKLLKDGVFFLVLLGWLAILLRRLMTG